jgi:hypothetical protein
MGGRLPRVNEWLYTVSSRGITTRPSTLLSKSVTPAQNAYGAYTQLLAGASVTDDCYEFDLFVGTVAIAASARDCLVTIGIDEAGGTSYTPVWSDIVVGPAGVYFSAGAYNAVGFRIPLKIKAGTSVAIKASVNSATLTAIVADCILRGRPTRPGSRVGRQLRADVRREHGGLGGHDGGPGHERRGRVVRRSARSPPATRSASGSSATASTTRR